MIVHDDEIRRGLKSGYTVKDVLNLLALLEAHGTLRFDPLPTGLYAAAAIDPVAGAQSGYGNSWVRDNIYVALAHEVAGHSDVACTVLEALAAFYRKYRNRFEAILEGRADPKLPENRPQVRFNGVNLLEISTRWPHAQNDALGYFLWFYCYFARTGRLVPDRDLLALFALYFEAIRYWEDEDSGHWEERPKIEASSIGAVVAGLRSLRELLKENKAPVGQRCTLNFDLINALIAEGEKALAFILPRECIQSDPLRYRRYDSALLFLVYPLDVVDYVMGKEIVDEVVENLQGEYGIRRYLGDSYWTANYKDKVPATELTADVSRHQEERDALATLGQEAQWCIFDPIVSVIAGRRYLYTHDPRDLMQQVQHLNRSLGQLTGPDCPKGRLRCPEAYYLDHGRYIPNDHVPLLWTQANLWMALLAMKESAAHSF